MLVQNNVKLVHAHFADIASDLALVLNKLTDIPFTLSTHAHDIFVHPLNLKEKCKNAKAVFTCSKYAQTFLQNQYHTKNIFLMYHGLDLANPVWENIYTERIRAFHSIYNQKSLRIVAIGRLVPKKGLAYFITAIGNLHKQGYSIHCRIIGDGPLKRKLKNQVIEFGNQITLIKSIPQNDLVKILKSCHFLIMPSVIASDGDRDNIPNVILEAQALGVPVIASNLPSIKEIIKHEMTGILVEPNNASAIAAAVTRYVSNELMLKDMIVAARRQIEEKFEIKKNVSTLISQWQKIF